MESASRRMTLWPEISCCRQEERTGRSTSCCCRRRNRRPTSRPSGSGRVAGRRHAGRALCCRWIRQAGRPCSGDPRLPGALRQEGVPTLRAGGVRTGLRPVDRDLAAERSAGIRADGVGKRYLVAPVAARDEPTAGQRGAMRSRAGRSPRPREPAPFGAGPSRFARVGSTVRCLRARSGAEGLTTGACQGSVVGGTWPSVSTGARRGSACGGGRFGVLHELRAAGAAWSMWGDAQRESAHESGRWPLPTQVRLANTHHLTHNSISPVSPQARRRLHPRTAPSGPISPKTSGRDVTSSTESASHPTLPGWLFGSGAES